MANSSQQKCGLRASGHTLSEHSLLYKGAMELADQYTTTVKALKDLARELRIRNPAKMLQASRERVSGANLRLATLALEDNVGKQVLAPAFRSTGRSTAEGPDERLQADLIDFSQNTRTKERYALLINDVYTREVRANTLLNKKPETINSAARELPPTLLGDKQDFTLTTDAGKEFSRLEEGGIPLSSVHRQKKKVRTISMYWIAQCNKSRSIRMQS